MLTLFEGLQGAVAWTNSEYMQGLNTNRLGIKYWYLYFYCSFMMLDFTDLYVTFLHPESPSVESIYLKFCCILVWFLVQLFNLKFISQNLKETHIAWKFLLFIFNINFDFSLSYWMNVNIAHLWLKFRHNILIISTKI